MKTTYKLLLSIILLIAQVSAPSLTGRAGGGSVFAQEARGGALSLASALAAIRDAQTDYTLHFIANDLEHLTVKSRPKNLPAPKAVQRLCKGQPVKVKVKGRNIFVQYRAEEDLTTKKVHLMGAVEDGFLEVPLPHAKVSILRADSSVVVDSAQIVVFYGNGMKMIRAQYGAEVSAAEGEYLVRSSMEGYDDVWQRVAIPRPLPEEVEVPTLKMRRSTTRTMRELTVTATKIKMFYRGDTLIYDATAFKLPEGSMLDDLIRQLPGVTMNDDGEIFVNGRKVDELLLGSRTFFGGNKRVLMENLPYYTVKNLKVYEKQTDKSVALGYDVEPRKYVMDVNLKDEYSQGYIANVEAAGGRPTPDPSREGGGQAGALLSSNNPEVSPPSREGSGVGLLRGFLLGFTDRLRFTLLANANNVNEKRHIGESDQWSPMRQPRSLTTTRSVAGEINYHTKHDELKETLRAEYTSSTDDQTMQQHRDYFIDGATLTSTTASFNRSGSRKLDLSNTFTLTKPFYLYSNIRFNHARRDGSFNSAFDEWSDSLTVSQRTVGISEGKAWNIHADVQGAFNVGRSKKQRMDFYFVVSRSNDESERATRYETTLSTVSPSSPSSMNSNSLFNRNTSFISNIGFSRDLGHDLHLGFSDFFYFRDQHNRDYLYHPLTVPEGSPEGHFEGSPEGPFEGSPEGPSYGSPEGPSYGSPEGHFGGSPAADTSPLLPSQIDVLEAITDPSNSYDSRDRDYCNDIRLFFNKSSSYLHPLAHMKIGYQRFSLELGTPLTRERLHYQRGTLDTLAYQTVFLPNATFRFRNVWKGGRRDLNFNIGTKQDRTLLLDRINFRDDSQPLVVKVNNPDLKPSALTTFGISYYDSSGPRNSSYHLGGRFEYHHRDIAQSFAYDPATGVSTYKPMNVSGAYRGSADFGTDRTIDEQRYWTWHLDAGAGWNHSKDYVTLSPSSSVSVSGGSAAGITTATESRVNTVNTQSFNSGANIRYNRKTLNVRAVGSIQWRHTAQPLPSLTGGGGGGSAGGEALSSLDFNYGLEASYTTPPLCGTKVGGLTLAADASMYSRRGYGTSLLNRDDFILNASLSQPFAKGKFILRIEAFDLLHQLSATQYEVNAQGRVETWYRSLPHYVMLHAVYHWNRNPKKK